MVYAINLDPDQIVALRAKDGKELWRKPIGSPGSESSPVVVNDRLIFGCQCGSVYALNPKTGATLWETETAGEIKSAVAYHEGDDLRLQLRRRVLRDRRVRRRRQVDHADHRRRLRPRRRLLFDPRGRLRARLRRRASTAASTRSTGYRRDRVDVLDRRRGLPRAGRGRRRGRSARASTSPPRTARRTRSTPNPAPSAGRGAWAIR